MVSRPNSLPLPFRTPATQATYELTLNNVLKEGVRDISQARAGGVETTKAGLVDREQIVLLQEYIYHLAHCALKDFTEDRQNCRSIVSWMRSRDLCTGVTVACFHSSGIEPSARDLFMSTVRGLAIVPEPSLRRREGIFAQLI